MSQYLKSVWHESYHAVIYFSFEWKRIKFQVVYYYIDLKKK